MPAERKLSKFIGSLIGTAVGDSLGSRFEGYSGFPKAAEPGPRYTDDTAMTLGVAEALVEQKGFDYRSMADRFIRNYEREPWRGYGAGPQHIFRMMQAGRPGFGMLDRDLYPGGSFGNGAAMRVAPVGLLYNDDLRRAREVAYQSASITHSNELALEGAALQACAVALAIRADPRNIKSGEFLEALRAFTLPGPYQEKLKMIKRYLDAPPGREEIATVLGNSVEALHSVPTAVYSFLANPRFEAAVVYAVGLGGDADTLGAMTGAIAGAFYGIEGIPVCWWEGVENREYIEGLARRLWKVKENLEVR